MFDYFRAARQQRPQAWPGRGKPFKLGGTAAAAAAGGGGGGGERSGVSQSVGSVLQVSQVPGGARSGQGYFTPTN